MKKILLGLVLLMTSNAYSLDAHSDQYIYHKVFYKHVCKTKSGIRYAIRYSDVTAAGVYHGTRQKKRIYEFAVSYDKGKSFDPIGHVYVNGSNHMTGAVRVIERDGELEFGAIYGQYAMTLKQVGKYKYSGIVDIYKDYDMEYIKIPKDISKYFTEGPQVVTCD